MDSSQKMKGGVTHLPPVIKGDADYRTYRPLLLDNGITVLLAHDPQSKNFAASVSVHAGASSDPRALPGLAHFCEHMCFLGSEAYPEENEYKQYLSQHGGKSNASTSMSHTTYQFDVLADHGEKALDIFSNFFISPLFTKSGTQREVQAVDSENSKNLVSDGRRRLQVLKSLADEEHHYSKFSTGNRITLPACAAENEKKVNDQSEKDSQTKDKHPLEDILKSINNGEQDENDMAEFVRAALLAFHERHYRPENMTAVMIGPQSLDELESWVVPRFGKIPDRWLDNGGVGERKDVENGDDSTSENEDKWQAMKRAAARLVGESASDAPPVSVQAAANVQHRSAFRPELQGGKWPVVVTTKPLRDIRNYVLHFPLPPTWSVPDRSPTSVLSHLFGHEGPGSAFGFLQDKGWISSLSAGSRVSGPDQTLFQIQMNLTNEGEEHWKEVVRVIFDYANILRNAAEEAFESSEGGNETCSTTAGGENELRRIWDEVAALDRMRFHQTSPGAVYSFAPSAAKSISKHGTEKFLSAGSLLNENGDTLPLKEVLEYVRLITPKNCFIERCSNSAWNEMETIYEEEQSNGSSEDFVFGKQTEKWYGVEYYVSPVAKADVSLWEEGAETSLLHLPAPNRYIPCSLELCEDLPEEAKLPRIEKEIDPPELIVNNSRSRLWWRLDDRYALPKASVTLLIRTATAENKIQQIDQSASNIRWDYSPVTAMQSNFITNIFSDALAQDTYDAYLAGLHWSLSKSSAGFTLSCSGYDDRLADLALKLLNDFTEGTFLKESHFATTQDKIVRGLRSYFESSRADSLALYYRNLLMSSKGEGIEKNLELAQNMALADVVEQHQGIWADKDMAIEVFYTGNVSRKKAESFFGTASDIIEKTKSKVEQEHAEQMMEYSPWVPGPFERRLMPGEDLELHFASKNPKEENGAVIVTFQSQKPGFKGKSLSSEESLKQSAAIRLLCRMIKEPVFNELRTKQQLGYIVSSYYDTSVSTRQQDFFESNSSSDTFGLKQPLTTTVDSLVVYVLSRKETPIEVASRIDDFLVNFKSHLQDMSPNEIEDYADSLAKALTKPIRKLGDEASNHFAKIRRYGPETLIEGSGLSEKDIGWDNAEVMAAAVKKLDRDALLQVYNSLVVSKESRSKIVSFVYGKTFPLELQAGKPAQSLTPGKFTASSLEELANKRKMLIAYDPSRKYPQQQIGSTLWITLGRHKSTMRFAAAAAAVVGIGVWGTMAMKGRGDQKKAK